MPFSNSNIVEVCNRTLSQFPQPNGTTIGASDDGLGNVIFSAVTSVGTGVFTVSIAVAKSTLTGMTPVNLVSTIFTNYQNAFRELARQSILEFNN